MAALGGVKRSGYGIHPFLGIKEELARLRQKSRKKAQF
jgi:hypothetical protein